MADLRKGDTDDWRSLRQENGNGGWKTSAMGAMWVVLMMVAGWGFADLRAGQSEVRSQIRALEMSRTGDIERIARLEEALRYFSETLVRIEGGVNELRRTRK